MRKQHPAIAVIDIGSNSARLVIYEMSSPYGFHLICEKKSKVRIGEHAYEKGGYLQPIGIHRAYLALKEFIYTIQRYPIQKTLCVATSALRDAPNGHDFTQWIKEELNLEIEIIDGKKEAEYGALAALNLLPIDEGITIDIGGGSSDLALIKDQKIIQSFSLNLGTVRLKELFFDKARPLHEAEKYIQKELDKLPKAFHHALAIGIGGTARSISKGIMRSQSYPLNKIHAFTYKIKEHQEYLNSIATANRSTLPYLSISKGRFDTIREGALIFQMILSTIHAKKVITSGVGVREGVFLEYFLKENQLIFPENINPSIVSIRDRFNTPHIDTKKRKISAKKLFRCFEKANLVRSKDQKSLLYAIELTSLGYTFNIYDSHQHAFYATMQEFNYGVTHQEIILTAMLLRFGGKELYNKEIYQHYKMLLPKKKRLKILSFIYSVLITLHENSAIDRFSFSLKKGILTIHANDSLYLAKERLKEIETPKGIELHIIDNEQIPSYNF